MGSKMKDYLFDNKPHVIGLDFGSLSCRGIIADSRDGSVVCEVESTYPHGVISSSSIYPAGIPEEWSLQNPDDYRECMISVIHRLVESSKIEPDNIAAIGIDATASTVIAADENLLPLCEKDGYRDRIHSWPKMWKHHASGKEAADLTRQAIKHKLPYIDMYGGQIGTEFFIPKVLQCYREDRTCFDAADTFFELGDWIASLLAGKEVRNYSMLKCKAMWTEGGGYPSTDFFDSVENGFGQAFYSKFSNRKQCVCHPGECVGTISSAMAEITGLAVGTVISAPQMDGYAGLPGCGVYTEGVMVMVLGTSTAYMLLDNESRTIDGLCASVRDSIIKGFTCHAAGQPGTGDMLQWYAENALPASYERKADEMGISVHSLLAQLAEDSVNDKLQTLAWFNGSKSVPINTKLSGVISGLTLNTKPEDIYRSMIEGSAFGAKAIIEHIRKRGVKINRIVCSGGISWKNPFIMQVYSDILETELEVCGVKQAAALGSAIYAATAAGLYKDVPSAIKKMGGGINKVYKPNTINSAKYRNKYEHYLSLRDSILSKEKDRSVN